MSQALEKKLLSYTTTPCYIAMALSVFIDKNAASQLLLWKMPLPAHSF